MWGTAWRNWWVRGAMALLAVAVVWFVWTAVADDDSDSASPASSSPASAASSPTSAAPTEPQDSERTAEPRRRSSASPDAPTPTGRPTAAATDAAGDRTALEPVEPNESARLSRSVLLEVVEVESVRSKVVLPDDTAGPALRVTLRVINRSSRPLDTRFAVVNAYHGRDLTPANALSEPGGRPLPTSVAARRSTTGVYLFAIDRRERANVTLEVDLVPQLPVARFVGSFR